MNTAKIRLSPLKVYCVWNVFWANRMVPANYHLLLWEGVYLVGKRNLEFSCQLWIFLIWLRGVHLPILISSRERKSNSLTFPNALKVSFHPGPLWPSLSIPLERSEIQITISDSHSFVAQKPTLKVNYLCTEIPIF